MSDQPHHATGPVADAPVSSVVAHHLARLDDLPVAEHPAVFEAVHQYLQQALAAVNA